MLDDLTIDLVQNEALKYLKEHLDKRYTYHNALHTFEVCSAIKEFAQHSDIPRSEYEALRIAAIFHDFGYICSGTGNEALSLNFMQDFAGRFAMDTELIDRANALILETVFPYAPQTAAGALLCDADIEYIGRSCFIARAELFRQELAGFGTVLSDEDFWCLELDFLQKNCFFTPVCKKLRAAERTENIRKVQSLLNNMKK